MTIESNDIAEYRSADKEKYQEKSCIDHYIYLLIRYPDINELSGYKREEEVNQSKKESTGHVKDEQRHVRLIVSNKAF